MAVRTPPFAAIMPSLDTASFNVTNGRWARTRMKKPARSCAASPAISPVSTAIPAWRKRRYSLAVDPRVRVPDGEHRPRNAGRDQRIRTGRGASMVAAWFERDIGGRSPRRFACHGERLGFGMRPTARRGSADSDHLPVLDDEAADRRVVAARPQRPPADPQRMRHMAPVGALTSSGHRRRKVHPAPPRNPWLRGNCGRPRRSAHRRHRQGSAGASMTSLPMLSGGDLGLAGAFELPHDARYHALDPVGLDRPLAQRDLDRAHAACRDRTAPAVPIASRPCSSRNCTRSKVVKRPPQSGQWRRRRMAEPSSEGRLSFTWVSLLLQNGQRITPPGSLGGASSPRLPVDRKAIGQRENLAASPTARPEHCRLRHSSQGRRGLR